MLDVAIALALVFFMLAVLVSGLYELLASAMATRGKLLLEGIASLCAGAAEDDREGKKLTSNLLSHGLLDALKKKDSRPPSYIPSASFALVFADTLVRQYGAARPLLEGLPDAVNRMPTGKLRETLLVLVSQAQGDAAKLQQLLEQHFNNVMDRVGGWYKRHAQAWMLGIGFVVAATMNIDAIHITGELIGNRALTDKLVTQATQLVVSAEQQQEKAAETGNVQVQAAIAPQVEALKQQVDKLQELQLPIGWNEARCPGCSADGKLFSLDSARAWALMIVGWGICALAASFGAPFWFDALSKLVSMRGSGKTVDTKASDSSSPQEKPAAIATTAVTTVAKAPTSEESTEPANDFESDRLTPLDIESLQRALGLDESLVTGKLDSQTRNAVRLWQQRAGKPVTGTLDEPLMLAILYPPSQA